MEKDVAVASWHSRADGSELEHLITWVTLGKSLIHNFGLQAYGMGPIVTAPIALCSRIFEQ